MEKTDEETAFQSPDRSPAFCLSSSVENPHEKAAVGPDLSPAFCLSFSVEDPHEKAAVGPDLSPTEPPDVKCDACTGRKRKAERSCLECVESYCEDHLELHNILHGRKRHKLVEATEGLQERTCPEHGRLLEVFCRTDQQCICHLCITDTHRTHDVVSIEVQVEEAHIKLQSIKKEIADRIKTREKEVQELKQAVDVFKTSAGSAMEETEKMFTELIRSMEKRKFTVKELLGAQEEAVMKKANELLHRIQEELNELKTREAELQQLKELSQTNHDIHFLQGVSSVPALPTSRDATIFFVHPYCSFEFCTDAVSDLVKQLDFICQLSFTKIPEKVKNAVILSSPAPKMREDFLQYATKLTLNPNTAHLSLRLSEENRVVTTVNLLEDYATHPDRFDLRAQILCNECLEGSPRYWEVEYGGGCWVCFAVSYATIQRKGKRGPLFGRNKYSWGLRCYSTSYYFWHNNEKSSVSYSCRSSRIGVYVDHSAGILAFYNVSDNMSLIHKVQTNFTKPLYAGFGLAGKGTRIKICDLNQEDMNEKKTLLLCSASRLI